MPCSQLCVTSSHHGVQKELWGHSCSVRGMSGKAGWKPGAERRGVCWKDDLETVLLSGWRAGRETCSTASQLDLASPPQPLPTMTQRLWCLQPSEKNMHWVAWAKILTQKLEVKSFVFPLGLCHILGTFCNFRIFFPQLASNHAA